MQCTPLCILEVVEAVLEGVEGVNCVLEVVEVMHYARACGGCALSFYNDKIFI